MRCNLSVLQLVTPCKQILTWTLARVLGDSCGLIRRYSMLNQLGAPCRAQHSTQAAATCQAETHPCRPWNSSRVTSSQQSQAAQAAHARQTSTHSSPALGSV